MIDDDFDRQEVDRLVRELTARKPPAVPTPALPSPPVPTPAMLESAPEPLPERPVRPVSRWSTVRILMPALAAARPRTTFASAISLPALASLSSLASLPYLAAFRLPALSDDRWRVRIVHGWVMLGLLLSVSMAYWPYPKTYLLGLLLYLFAVALVVVAGVWSAKLTWDLHLGGAHTVALGIVLWAIVLVAAETLQAVGGSAS